MSIRNRTVVADYIKVGEEFILMGTGFTDLNESPNAKVEKKQYINEKSPTSFITGYESEFDFETDQIREEKAIEYICSIGELHKTGSDAETEYIRVDIDKPGTTENTFRARKFKVAVQVDDLGAKDGGMGTKGKLLTQGDLEVGTFNTQTRTFTKGFEPKTH
ncbi:TPA: hypothetical protein K8M96_002811 [Clostridium perfringens]|nr:hypothetical protein [Clostridium perfringens]HBI6967502.1 hypothetical protein [Clostridium perfringens]HBI6970498.1 hypothetical protein [Clostridium perfringens]HBI6973504.1 hypothetical protein [Clostridium perfringens]HBI6987548.1 hypothetical protein [Clostridium perfringens]